MGKKEYREERRAKKTPEEQNAEANKYKIDWTLCRGLTKDAEAEDLCTIEASSITGFEAAAQQEAKDRLKLEHVYKYQGRIIFDIEKHRVKEVLVEGFLLTAESSIGSF